MEQEDAGHLVGRDLVGRPHHVPALVDVGAGALIGDQLVDLLVGEEAERVFGLVAQPAIEL